MAPWPVVTTKLQYLSYCKPLPRHQPPQIDATNGRAAQQTIVKTSAS